MQSLQGQPALCTAPHATSPLAMVAGNRQYGIKKTAPVPIGQA